MTTTTTTTTPPTTMGEASPPAGVPVLPWILVGSGVVVGALGVAGDTLLPSSKDGVLDGVDFVWPVAWMGVAPVLLGVGGGMLLFAMTDTTDTTDDTVAVTGGR